MSRVLTDNSYFEVKVKLRNDNLPRASIKVLDCFSGTGRIWQIIQKRNPKRKIQVFRIDKQKHKGGIYLVGDNKKFLQSLNPDNFNVIDLDTYGVPFEQLKWLFNREHRKKKVVFVTFIQSLFGGLPDGLLEELGYTKAMTKKCPTLFYRNGFEKLKLYLANNGIKRIKHYYDDSGRKHYLCFETGADAGGEYR